MSRPDPTASISGSSSKAFVPAVSSAEPAVRDPGELLWPLAAFAAAVALYLRTLAFRMVWDDIPLIVRNPVLHQPGAWLRAWTGTFWGPYNRERAQADFYRPLASFSFWLDHAVWGGRPLGYHLTNVLLAGAGAALLYALL